MPTSFATTSSAIQSPMMPVCLSAQWRHPGPSRVATSAPWSGIRTSTTTCSGTDSTIHPPRPENHDMHPSGLRSALAFTFALVLAPSARSAVITVDTLSPRPLLYQCDFRSAVIAANTNMPARGCPAGDPHMPDEIRFHPGLAGSISMAVPVEIAESLVIDGG